MAFPASFPSPLSALEAPEGRELAAVQHPAQGDSRLIGAAHHPADNSGDGGS